jgi:hypothetical protein
LVIRLFAGLFAGLASRLISRYRRLALQAWNYGSAFWHVGLLLKGSGLSAQDQQLPSQPEQQHHAGRLSHQEATLEAIAINPQRQGIEHADAAPSYVLTAMHFWDEKGCHVKRQASQTHQYR